MSASAADRVRLCRERARDGRAVLLVEVDLQRVRDVLGPDGAGLLKEWDDHDRRAIAAALGEAIEIWLDREQGLDL